MNPVVYTNPDTKIDICRGVPLPQNYEHVCSFESDAATYAAFTPFFKYSNIDCIPVKVPNAVRVPYGFNLLADCNYIIFSNYSSGQNRVYAFITEIRYVNANLCEIEYKVDIWTTNYHHMSFGRCFVEREHVLNDAFGLHTIPEGLETGDFKSIAMKSLNYDNNYTAILHVPEKTDEVKASIINGIYTGLKCTVITSKSEGLISDAIENITQDYQYPEKIVAIYHYPSFMGTLSNATIGSQFTDVLKPSSLDGYVPKNNKCFTGEFCYLLLDDLNGSTHVYQFENSQSEGNAITFRSCGTFITMPVINTYPIQYKGMPNCYMEGITTTNFPNCAWTSDAFAQWWAQNKNAMGVQAASSALNLLSAGIMGAVHGSLTGGSAGAITGAAGGVAAASVSSLTSALGRAAQIETKQQQPAQIHGQTLLDSLNTADNRLHFNFYTMSVRNEVAQQIDSFFETFGYRVNQLKTPNITGRPHWNYVKTANAVINGTLYMDTTGEVETILNNGVTIWHDINNLGNYNLNNH